MSRPPTISSLISSAAAHLCAASIAAPSSRVSVLYWSGGVALRAIGFSGERPHSRMVWRYFPASRILVASDSRKRGTCGWGRMWDQKWAVRRQEGGVAGPSSSHLRRREREPLLPIRACVLGGEPLLRHARRLAHEELAVRVVALAPVHPAAEHLEEGRGGRAQQIVVQRHRLVVTRDRRAPLVQQSEEGAAAARLARPAARRRPVGARRAVRRAARLDGEH